LILAGVTGAQILLSGVILFGGIGMALLGVTWGVAATSLDNKSASACMPGVIAFAALLGFVTDQTNPPLAMALTFLLPIISTAFLALFQRSTAYDEREDESRSDRNDHLQESAAPQYMKLLDKVPWRFILILALFCAAFGTMQYLLVIPESNADQISKENILFRGLVALFFFIEIGVFSLKPATMFKAGFLTMIAGFMAVPFIGSPAISSAIIMMGYTCFDMLAWIIICSLGSAWRADATRIVAIARLTSLGGVLLGSVLGVVVGYWAALGQANVAVVTTAMAYLLVMATVLSMDQSPVGFWQLISDTASHARRTAQRGQVEAIEEIAVKGALTPREREFFGYLAAGRSIPWISSHLCISDGTSRAHARHIYAKLQVHSRQELLDVVDREAERIRRNFL
jgi:DNA-binding CsgD family transcriptional regulator